MSAEKIKIITYTVYIYVDGQSFKGDWSVLIF
jgi:hypothetical protein